LEVRVGKVHCIAAAAMLIARTGSSSAYGKFADLSAAVPQAA
jgi:hypothetical protein